MWKTQYFSKNPQGICQKRNYPPTQSWYAMTAGVRPKKPCVICKYLYSLVDRLWRRGNGQHQVWWEPADVTRQLTQVFGLRPQEVEPLVHDDWRRQQGQGSRSGVTHFAIRRLARRFRWWTIIDFICAIRVLDTVLIKRSVQDPRGKTVHQVKGALPLEFPWIFE